MSCKDCPPGSKRPATPPGPRCATHHRENRKRQKGSAHEQRVQKVYGLGPGDYDNLYRVQGGTCAICKRAKGIAKKLAVDHDHKTGLVRGLLCGPCNKILGHLRDDPELARGIVSYLGYTPAEYLGITAIHQDNRGEDGSE